MLIPLSTTPHWWETEDYSCVREVIVERSKAVDLDVLQAAINVSGRDKFRCDVASRRVAMKRMYQGHPVNTLCQEGLGECNGVVGATFILIIILYRICSKQSRVHAARIKTRNRPAVVHAIKVDHTTKHCLMCPICHKADHKSIEGSCCAKARTTANPAVCRDQEMRVIKYSFLKTNGANLLVVIQRFLLMSGDIELNPGPLDGEYLVTGYKRV